MRRRCPAVLYLSFSASNACLPMQGSESVYAESSRCTRVSNAQIQAEGQYLDSHAHATAEAYTDYDMVQSGDSMQASPKPCSRNAGQAMAWTDLPGGTALQRASDFVIFR